MWRFIVLTFAFLGWSFYILSGGADYEPRPQSIQARAKLDNLRPYARPTPVVVAAVVDESQASDEEETVTRALSSLDDLNLSDAGRLQITLASINAESAEEPTFEADPQKAEALTHAPDAAIEDANKQAEMDIRQITGTVVNMRDGPSTYFLAIGKLRQGDEVEVLENPGEGWLKIRATETDQVGWMADWLVSTAAN